MFSLCIPTMNRYDSYLHKFLPVYLNIDSIDEIIICDENGNDANKIMQQFPDNKKLKLYTNVQRLGPFYNKIKCCRLAKNDWIALIDSDNFADIDYFEKMEEFINNNKLENKTILSPVYASKAFHWEHLCCPPNNIINKSTFKHMRFLDQEQTRIKPDSGNLDHLMNTGNYIINKYIIDKLDVTINEPLNRNSHSFDVVLFLYLCFTQLDIDFYIVDGARYSHSTSPDSVYLQYHVFFKDYAVRTYKQLWEVLTN